MARKASSSPACHSASNLVTVLGASCDSRTSKKGSLKIQEFKVSAVAKDVNDGWAFGLGNPCPLRLVAGNREKVFLFWTNLTSDFAFRRRQGPNCPAWRTLRRVEAGSSNRFQKRTHSAKTGGKSDEAQQYSYGDTGTLHIANRQSSTRRPEWSGVRQFGGSVGRKQRRESGTGAKCDQRSGNQDDHGWVK